MGMIEQALSGMNWIAVGASAAVVSALIALVACIASIFAASNANKAAWEANKASVLDQRLAIYSFAQELVSDWGRNGRPDMNKLPGIFDAINKAHFLFPDEVQKFLEELRDDAFDADTYARRISGEIPNAKDVKAAIAQEDALKKKYIGDPFLVRKVFSREMKMY
jgi:hypothetical protein